MALCFFFLARQEVHPTIACPAQGPWGDVVEGQEGPCQCHKSGAVIAQAQDQDGLWTEMADTQGVLVQFAGVVVQALEAVAARVVGRTAHQANLLLPWVHLS